MKKRQITIGSARFANRIRELREDKGLTQREVKAASESYMQKIEAGRVVPGRKCIVRLAKALAPDSVSSTVQGLVRELELLAGEQRSSQMGRDQAFETTSHLSREPATQLVRPQPTQDHECVLSMDGIILNSVGEVIYERVPESTLVECRRSYRRALEDFSFAVVYGSQLNARWPYPLEPLLEPKNEKKEPAELIISSLPMSIYGQETFDKNLSDEMLFENRGHKNQIREYIRHMGKCVEEEPYFVRLCRDFIAREAEIYMGTHPNLFKEVRDPSDRHFGKEYCRHDLSKDVRSLLGRVAMSQLVEFVPRFPAKSKGEQYTEQARVQFVGEVVLTHIKTMYQQEKHCEKQRHWRMPYALRAEVTKRAQKTQTQRNLRYLIVRHALLFALRNTPRDDRRLLITTLVTMRGHHPFKLIREMLEEMSLIQLQPDVTSEARAMKLIQEICNTAGPQRTEPTDSYLFARNSVLKEISNVNQTEYETLLSGLFPELREAPR